MNNRELSARRIVEIQDRLPAAGANIIPALLREQRELWDRDHAGRAFDEIAHDVWLVKQSQNYG